MKGTGHVGETRAANDPIGIYIRKIVELDAKESIVFVIDLVVESQQTEPAAIVANETTRRERRRNRRGLGLAVPFAGKEELRLLRQEQPETASAVWPRASLVMLRLINPEISRRARNSDDRGFACNFKCERDHRAASGRQLDVRSLRGGEAVLGDTDRVAASPGKPGKREAAARIAIDCAPEAGDLTRDSDVCACDGSVRPIGNRAQ